ncbi:hypothetical protein ACFLTK_02210 [Chloroflexota bacterium]
MISELRKRIAPNKQVVTLDIDSATIRVLEISGRVVIKWASISLEPFTIEGGVVSDQQALGAKVSQLMDSSDIKASNVIASLNGLYSTNRILTIPERRGGLTTQQAVLEAAREMMPLDTEGLYLAWQAITTGKDEQQALVVGVPRDVLDSEVQALKAVGINPRILEPKFIALTRIVNSENAIILNIEPSSFDIIIVVNSVPEIIRTVAARESELNEEDKAEHIVTTLDLTINFFNSNHLNMPLEPATPTFITGQLSGDLALMEKLRARLIYQVEPLVTPLEYPEYFPASQYAINMGLALTGTKPTKNVMEGGSIPLEINLLPEIYQPWKPSTRLLYSALLLIGAIVLIVYLFQITTKAMDETTLLQQRYDILNNELQRRQLEIASRAPMQNAIDEYGIIEALGGNFTEDLEIINHEASLANVQVDLITHTGNSITVACVADSHLTFREYLTALEESGRFTNPVPPPEGYPFTTSGIIELEPIESNIIE